MLVTIYSSALLKADTRRSHQPIIELRVGAGMALELVVFIKYNFPIQIAMR